MTKKQTIQSVKGMHDILPADQNYWQFFIKKAKTLLDDYGFERIDTPILEPKNLFVRSVGESTDIVEKEMYTLKTKGGDDLALRPEGTSPVARAYIEHGMHTWPHPIQLWYLGPFFRHENPQAGRLRQFHQLGMETLGDESSAIDTQLIFIAYRLLEGLGLKNIVVKINSIGDSSCRPQYIKALKDYFRIRGKKLCAKCRARLKTNILRVLDCADANCKEVIKDAPNTIDYLDDGCKTHFRGVLEFLDEVKIPYLLDSRLVRGLDYYTRTVFELWPEEKPGEETIQSALCAGGRYDKLVNLLGGPKTPAAGWAMGVERVIMALKTAGVNVPSAKVQPRVFIAQLGEFGKRKSLVLFEEFRKAGIAAKASLGRDSIKSQLRIANRLGIKYTLIIGQKEALDDTVILREMDSGVQETIPTGKILDVVRQRLKN